MTFYKINKLVRDKFIQNCAEVNAVAYCRKTLNSDFYRKILEKKLLEEAKEVVVEKNRENLKEEIADLLEVVDCIVKYYKFSKKEILNIKNAKRNRKGSFKKSIFCEKIEIDDSNDDYWSSYIRAKYKKLNDTAK